MQAIEAIQSGSFPEPGELLDQLSVVFPLIKLMATTPQDMQWHAEGSVRVHTEMVIAEVYRLIRSGDHELSPGDQLTLILGAALHDIGKGLTTREEEIDGVVRIVSPNHTDRGRSIVAPLIGKLGLTDQQNATIHGLIRHHHDPKKLVMRSSERRHFSRLARSVNLRLLYLLESCDLRGRITADVGEQLELLELFRIESESLGLFDQIDPYQEWYQFFDEQIPVGPARDYVKVEAIRLFENALVNSPQEALGKTWSHRDQYSTVTVITAPSGSGKSTWISEHSSPGQVVISLDEIRSEMTGKRGDQSKNGQVLQLAKERLREALRSKRDAVWDSTALRRDGRAAITGLGHDYHARTRIVALAVHPDVAMKQNAKRGSSIPTSILEKQYRQWQWPDIWEAHEVQCLFTPPAGK